MSLSSGITGSGQNAGSADNGFQLAAMTALLALSALFSPAGGLELEFDKTKRFSLVIIIHDRGPKSDEAVR